MKKILKLVNKSMATFMLLAFVVSSIGISPKQFVSVANAATTWDTTGAYVIDMNYMGTDYAHSMTLVQDISDNLTGNGSHNAYTWVINSGTVVNDSINFTANYTATPDATTPLTVLTVAGTIAPGGTMSGTWTDNYQGSPREGTWTTVSGAANPSVSDANFVEENFNVVDTDTGGFGTLAGYSTGFALTGETYAQVTSVVVQLFADGDQLLQTDTANFPLFATISGSQITAPFDVSGNFDYMLDGYWTNVRESQYGQSVPATKVVATLTLQNGNVLVATNINLTGEDPSTIYPEAANVTTDPATAMSSADATLNGTNGDSDALGHSFWASLNTFSTASPVLTPGVTYSTPDLGPITANTPFSALLSSTGIIVTPSTTYYFAAWSNVEGTWYPGEVLSFTTLGTGGEEGGEIGGDVVPGNGTLEVTSVQMTDSTATANNSYEDGWEYVFNITVPTDEPDLSMKFADWARIGGGGTIPAGGNMRISSAQANNGGATVPITAANTYSTPALTMTTDLNGALDGIQVQVVVEVKIPGGTPSGSYTTSYGVKSE